jgi:hypothetical protein
MVFVLAGLLVLAACGGAEGLRNIASVTADAYFSGDWRLELTDVQMARILPALTVVAKVTRADCWVDSSHLYQHIFRLGPVVNFSKTLYLEAVYGLGIDSDYSDGRFSHEVDVNFNYETDTTATSLGLRADWFPRPAGEPDYYLLPSVSGKFHPLPALGLFGKFFLSVANDLADGGLAFTESFWGQADYRFSPLLGARAGFTVSLAETFGYSLTAGLDFFFRRAVALKYTFQFLSDSIDLSDLEPRSGVSNALILDVRF